MKDVTGKPHKFFTETIDIHRLMARSYADKWYNTLKNIDPEKAKNLSYKKDVDGTVMQAFIEEHNVLLETNDISYKVLSAVRRLTKEACEYYGIDYAAEKYHIHAWLNYAKGPRIIREYDQVALDDHGIDPKRFHGYYAINAEPSKTFYELDEDNPDQAQGLWPYENKNGRVMLSLSGYDHGVGNWESEEPRITLAYNVIPLDQVPPYNPHGIYIPLFVENA